MKKYLLCLIILCCVVFNSVADEVSITVYNNNLGLVKDSRIITLEKGISEFSFDDVSAKIQPTSVHFKSLTAPDKVKVLEQNFEYDLVDAFKIMRKYVDKQVSVLLEGDDKYTGTLLSFTHDSIVLETASGIDIISLDEMQSISCEKLPEGLITKPTLVWELENQGAEKQDVQVSYLTNGMNWHAEYVAVTDANDENLEINGWVSIDNKSGVAYKDAQLKLIAGDVNIVKEEAPSFMRQKAASGATAEGGFEEKAFFEYHMYTLGRKTTLKNNQTKQISLFPSTMVEAEKRYIYNAFNNGTDVEVKMQFQNSKDAGMGMPLPKGKVRVYKQDVDGNLEFIGEDKIDHTPKDEEVRILLGNAFDIKAEKVRTDTKKIADRVREETFEITLRNHKEDDVTVTIVEKSWGDWEITESTHDYTKKDANTFEFTIAVAKDSKAMIGYTIRKKW